MATWTIEAGWTTSRPVRPDEFTSFILIEAETETEAWRTAAAWVAAKSKCQMSTTLRVIDVSEV